MGTKPRAFYTEMLEEFLGVRMSGNDLQRQGLQTASQMKPSFKRRGPARKSRVSQVNKHRQRRSSTGRSTRGAGI